MSCSRLFTKLSRRLAGRHKLRRYVQLEALESRLVPYAISGNAWPHPELITLSFMPDGSNLGGATSNLFSTMNARWSPSVWQREILRAAQVWAQVTNINFALVSDSGDASGSGAYQQGDPTFGDIRIAAYDSGPSNLGSAMMPPPANNYSVAGDFTLNSSKPWVINTTGGYDLFTVAAHEIGHSLGLYHSTVTAAEEYAFYNAIKPTLRADDIAGLRAIYSAGLGRTADAFDLVASNGSFLTASALTPLINPITKTALVENLDITSTGDTDYYAFMAPVGPASTLTVKAQSTGLSMLMPTLTVYNAARQQIGFASGAGQYGATLSLTVSGVTAGQVFYVKVAGAETSAFGTGKYALTLNFGAGASPDVPLPDTRTVNGSPIQGGGGLALRQGEEVVVSGTTQGVQVTYSGVPNPNPVAISPLGVAVIVWASEGQDSDSDGIFGQRFAPDGTPLESEFQVNSFVTDEQVHAVVATDALGNFVVAWASKSRDADGSWGIYARMFTALGIPLGEEFAVADGLGAQQYPAIAMSHGGDFVITWNGFDAIGNAQAIFAQRYSALGLPLGGAFQVNTSPADVDTAAPVAMDLFGNFVITWTGPDPLGGTDVFAKIYLADGTEFAQEFVANSYTFGFQTNPAVAMADDGDFVITWSSHAQDGDGWGAYAQRFTNAGIPRDPEFRVNTASAGDQWEPTVAVLANGEAVISWTATGTDGSTGVYAQQFSAAGEPVGRETPVNTTTSGYQWRSAVAAAEDGFVVVWNGQGGADSDGVFAQRYEIAGGGGVALAEDDFYGITEHENGCGCAVCQAAASAAEATVAGDVLALMNPDGRDEPGRSPVAAATVPGTEVVVPSTQVANDRPPSLSVSERPRLSRPSMPPSIAIEDRSEEPAPSSEQEAAPVPTPSVTEVEVTASRGTDVLDFYFAQELAETVQTWQSPETEITASDESSTPLAGLGLVLAGVWAMRPGAAGELHRRNGMLRPQKRARRSAVDTCFIAN
jgi:Matrixin